MKAGGLAAGDVVQIDPSAGGFFPACFMLVTEVKGWGAQGFVSVPKSRDESPGRAFFRATWEQMELVGKATWVTGDDE